MFTKIDHMLVYNRTSSTLQRIEIITIIGHDGIKLEINNNKMVRKCPKNYLEMKQHTSESRYE